MKGYKALKKEKAEAELAAVSESEELTSVAAAHSAKGGRRISMTAAIEGEDSAHLRQAALEKGVCKITLKDLNLICAQPECAQTRGFFAIHPEAAAKLHEQIAVDVALLTKHNLMDYSLLLGVHHLDPAEAAAAAKKNKKKGINSLFSKSRHVLVLKPVFVSLSGLFVLSSCWTTHYSY